MKPTPSAGAVIVKDNEILLTKRSDKLKHFPGFWCIPGGKIDAGETAEEAVIREIKEEIGVDFIIDYFLGYYDEIFPDIDFHHVSLAFVGTIKGEISASEREVQEWKWVSLEEALKMKLAFEHKKILEDYYTKHKKRQ